MVLDNRGVGGDLPVRLGGQNVTHRGADGFDVYVDGIPFLLSINDQVAFSDKTAQWKKDQFDNSPEPGEQSLSDWWSRSQIAFHGGVGQKYLDSYANADEISRIRFDSGFNVEMQWPLGQVTALPAAETILPQSGGIGAGFIFPFTGDDGFRWVLATDGDQIRWWKDTLSGPMSGSISHGSGFTIQGAATDGEKLFVASEGGVFAVDSSLTPVKLYDIGVTAPKLVLGWTKARLMLAVNATVYQLESAPAATTLPDPLYTHPTPRWEWTCFTDGLTSILAAGHAGPVSNVMEFTLDTSTGTPTLGGAQVAATMPHGEVAYSVQNHAGAFVAIGTSKGVRVGHYDSFYGHFSYGPLSVMTTRPVRSLASHESFVFFGIESMDGYSSCLGKLDLGTPLDQGNDRFAWSPHQPPPTLTQATIRHVTVDDAGLLLFNVDGIGVVRQNPTLPTTLPAFVATSKIRVGTLEPKAFRYVQVRAELEPGEWVTVTPTVAEKSLPAATAMATNTGARFDVGATSEWCSLRFDLSAGAVLTGYTLYALPAQQRYRTLQIPMWLANSEKSRSGRVYSSPRWAQERYTALREIESRGDEIELRFPALGYPVTRGVIEDITFVQTSPPTDRGRNGMAGVCQITFRTTR